MYTQPLNAAGIATESVAITTRARLDEAIHKVMEGRDDATSAQSAEDALNELRARSVDRIILASTEISLLLGERATAPDLINPLQLLADAAVRHALG